MRDLNRRHQVTFLKGFGVGVFEGGFGAGVGQVGVGVFDVSGGERCCR